MVPLGKSFDEVSDGDWGTVAYRDLLKRRPPWYCRAGMGRWSREVVVTRVLDGIPPARDLVGVSAKEVLAPHNGKNGPVRNKKEGIRHGLVGKEIVSGSLRGCLVLVCRCGGYLLGVGSH